MKDIKLPPMPNNLMNVLRRIRLCEGETAALLVFEHALIDYARAAVELNCSVPEYDQTALALCEVCGWKTLIPCDLCLNCDHEKRRAGHEEQAQPAERKPLTSTEIADIWDSTLFHITDITTATDFVRDVERAHEIGD